MILPFEIVYGFNPLSWLDLISLHVDERGCLDGKKKAKLVRLDHEKVRLELRRRIKIMQAIKGRRHVNIWTRRSVLTAHAIKHFPAQNCILEEMDQSESLKDAYKLDLPSELLCLLLPVLQFLSVCYAGEDPRLNLFKERMNDE